jgi:hypothetical protein
MSTISVPKTGSYLRRAQALRLVLRPDIQKAFGDLSDEVRGSAKEPVFWWTLPEKVDLHITKTRRADPEVWVTRRDPIHVPPQAHDWKNERFGREGGRYNVASIIAYAKTQVDENRRKRETHEANEKAKTADLAGLELPEQVHLERDAKTGVYGFRMEIDRKGLSVDEVRRVVGSASEFLKAMPPDREEPLVPPGA